MSATLDNFTTIELDDHEASDGYSHLLTIEDGEDGWIALQDIVADDGRPLNVHSLVLTIDQADALQRDLQRRIGRARA